MLKTPAINWKKDFTHWLQANLPHGFQLSETPSWPVLNSPAINVGCDLSIQLTDNPVPRYLIYLIDPDHDLQTILESAALTTLVSGSRHLVILIHGHGREHYFALGPINVQLLYHDFSNPLDTNGNDILDSIFDE